MNPEDPQRFLKCPQTLKEWAAYYGGEERYKFWLTPNDQTPAWLRGSVPAAQTATVVGTGTTPGGSPYTPSGMDEFARATTTSHDEAQAMQTSGTNFSTLKDTLLSSAKKPGE